MSYIWVNVVLCSIDSIQQSVTYIQFNIVIQGIHPFLCCNRKHDDSYTLHLLHVLVDANS